jgi:hypothetical protein
MLPEAEKPPGRAESPPPSFTPPPEFDAPPALGHLRPPDADLFPSVGDLPIPNLSPLTAHVCLTFRAFIRKTDCVVPPRYSATFPAALRVGREFRIC